MRGSRRTGNFRATESVLNSSRESLLPSTCGCSISPRLPRSSLSRSTPLPPSPNVGSEIMNENRQKFEKRIPVTVFPEARLGFIERAKEASIKKPVKVYMIGSLGPLSTEDFLFEKGWASTYERTEPRYPETVKAATSWREWLIGAKA